MTAPCKDCLNRRRLCHSECEKYAAFQAEREQIKQYNLREQIAYDASWGKGQRYGHRKKH